MTQVQSFFAKVGALLSNLLYQPDWRNLLDVLIVTILIYQALKLVMRTRANSVFKGIGLLLAAAWLSSILQLTTLNWLMQQVINTGVIVIVILFQPELRRALEQLGRSKITRQVFGTSSRSRVRHTEQQVSEIVRALNNMARKRIGALIVIQRQTSLGDVMESGTILDADISAPLIENVFEPNTPLHDGAMIISGERITAAACILQLSDDYSISRELGTRHRAAIGITETTDAVSLIVSEETGIISMARDGRLTRYLDSKSLTILLTELFTPENGALSSWFTNIRSKRKEDSHEK